MFYKNDRVFRAITASYVDTWNELASSGLIEELVEEKKLIPYKVVTLPDPIKEKATIGLEVEKIPFISYPSEWTFLQLKKAALLTLDLQLKALAKGYTLKDASAFNVQFRGNKATLIDVLSFEKYSDGSPWLAYRQFCTHFLAPLLLVKYSVPGVRELLSGSIDGITLSTCSALLPYRSRFNILSATHVHLHARLEIKHQASEATALREIHLPKKRQVAMLTHMRDGIKGLRAPGHSTNWTSYYDDFSYSREGAESKKNFVSGILRHKSLKLCLDLGCNTGEFSLLAAEHCSYVVACDADEQVVMKLQGEKKDNLLPLCVDLANPTPFHGWNHSERKSFLERAKGADCVLALALVHHLCISYNISLDQLAAFFSRFSGLLIIEFVPLSDVQVKKLLVSRKNIFSHYTEQNFVTAFLPYYSIESHMKVPGSERKLFHMKRNDA